MMRARTLFLPVIAVLGLVGTANAVDPNVIMGVPQPSAQPTPPACGNAKVGIYGDPVGCLYACVDGAQRILAGVTCVFPTSAATLVPTATPTPTATATATVTPVPTITASLTPTPTVTSTP